MAEPLAAFVEKLKSDADVSKLTLAARNQAIIAPVLQRLGWEIYDVKEVAPEISAEGKRIDYTLRLQNENAVLLQLVDALEVPEKEEPESPENSLLQKFTVAAVTDGLRWWFFLPPKSEERRPLRGAKGADRAGRKFLTINMIGQETAQVAQALLDLLSKDQVRSGKAARIAESYYTGSMRQERIEATLPIAWNEIVVVPASALVELLAAETEKLSGFKPDSSEVEEFLNHHAATLVLPTHKEPASRKPSAPPPPVDAIQFEVKPAGVEEDAPQTPQKESAVEPLPELESPEANESTRDPEGGQQPSVTFLVSWGRKLASHPRYAACRERADFTALLKELAGKEYKTLPVDAIIQTAVNLYIFAGGHPQKKS